jgi:hypothetical protein
VTSQTLKCSGRAVGRLTVACNQEGWPWFRTRCREFRLGPGAVRRRRTTRGPGPAPTGSCQPGAGRWRCPGRRPRLPGPGPTRSTRPRQNGSPTLNDWPRLPVVSVSVSPQEDHDAYG